MRIAFYAPLKSPNHPVPSGDRQMARALIDALEHAGSNVEIVSEFRSFKADPTPDSHAEALAEADSEVNRLAGEWRAGGTPDLFFCYHPYYKSPDLLGPRLAEMFGLRYVTTEASYSSRRNQGVWADTQAIVLDAIQRAAMNICLTRRDQAGLLEAAPEAPIVMLPPFIDVSSFRDEPPPGKPGKFVTVAMMRDGDKLDSYKMLARSLALIADLPWTLTIVGDGPARAEVVAAFDTFEPSRIEWLGALPSNRVASVLAGKGIFVWPGCGEAYGLAYLEAQAAGLPVVAQDTAGVPEVVRHGETGILTPPGDDSAYAESIGRLLARPARRDEMAAAARRFAIEERSLERASRRLGKILAGLPGR